MVRYLSRFTVRLECGVKTERHRNVTLTRFRLRFPEAVNAVFNRVILSDVKLAALEVNIPLAQPYHLATPQSDCGSGQQRGPEAADASLVKRRSDSLEAGHLIEVKRNPRVFVIISLSSYTHSIKSEALLGIHPHLEPDAAMQNLCMQRNRRELA